MASPCSKRSHWIIDASSIIRRDRALISSALCDRGPCFESFACSSELSWSSMPIPRRLCMVLPFLYREAAIPVVAHTSTNIPSDSAVSLSKDKRYVFPTPVRPWRKNAFPFFVSLSSCFLSRSVYMISLKADFCSSLTSIYLRLTYILFSSVVDFCSCSSVCCNSDDRTASRGVFADVICAKHGCPGRERPRVGQIFV